MPDQKLDNLLNLALSATEREREKSGNLNVGYNQELRLWDVFVKYNGDTSGLEGPGVFVVPLLGEYAVVTLPENELETYARRPQIEFMEIPKRLFFADYAANQASCITSLQTGQIGGAGNLTGKGILVGIVDSGVDYRHPDFRHPDGSTRILRLWDQEIPGNPPKGYVLGTEYTKAQIDEALELTEREGRELVPSQDLSRHGTSVLGIAAGNGRASEGLNRGVAFESELVVVKLGRPRENSFPRTTELIQGIDYLVRMSRELGKPMVINLSFGNNYGSHRGDSLVETYIDNVSDIGRLVLCTGTGNNGSDALHAGGRISSGERKEVQFGVGAYETTLNIQLWKDYEDEIEIYMENPAGERIGPLYEELGAQRHRLGNTELLIYYGKPAPYHVTQEIYFDILPIGNFVDSGVWKLLLRGKQVKRGEYFLWMPGGNVLNPGTNFYSPRPQGTLTIPSTSGKIISVGAYDSARNSYADFSGRGSAFLTWQKPDLVAPGVNITAPVPGGGYGTVSGTSFAAPFVAGAAALLMEWGIVRENDPFLYGEKVKAYLRRGARPLPGYEEYPNPEVGWGALCVSESLP